MDAYHFCGEYGRELRSGRVAFSLRDVKRFIRAYTDLNFDDLTKEMIARIRLEMINMYIQQFKHHHTFFKERPPEKIILPEWIFK